MDHTEDYVTAFRNQLPWAIKSRFSLNTTGVNFPISIFDLKNTFLQCTNRQEN